MTTVASLDIAPQYGIFGIADCAPVAPDRSSAHEDGTIATTQRYSTCVTARHGDRRGCDPTVIPEFWGPYGRWVPLGCQFARLAVQLRIFGEEALDAGNIGTAFLDSV